MSSCGSEAVERVAQFLLDGARVAAGVRSLQGAWSPSLPCRSASALVRSFAEIRVYRVPRSAALALVGWGDGLPVDLWFEIPSGDHVLGLQAGGRRCVSILSIEAAASMATTPFDFAVHDLCHVSKFFDPRHYEEQVGFFATLVNAMALGEWRVFEAGFDEEWRRDRLHVGSDMNGSAVFLFAVLKMKLKMAVRRRLARTAGVDPPRRGGLDETEARVYEETFARLLDLLSFSGHVRAAAIKTSARRDCPHAATTLMNHFRDVGRERLGRGEPAK